ncbi:DegT/DnrJ/EryC1/StrS family aminotransferase [Streptomyces sp. JW3]|uniref:DegT/DnrJ/EryC1/StrS family aminotransferase n=1 Tax=Streptomyces sp. JW3 TaxID=3456955 RepID=UPI003FA4A13F
MAPTQFRTLRLAIDGGLPVRSPDAGWPTWPQPAKGAEEELLTVLHSGRWALSSPYRGELSERRFADRFARYTGARHCIPTDHGSSALVIALESLGLDHGDLVLVPALTWTASATAVLRAGLVPVLVDVDPATGCVDPGTLDLDVGARAVIAVHWACSMADVPALTDIAGPRGMSVIEDAAQAHGAQWQGRHAGTLGRVGCFSMQHGKVLSAGEGGAVVTDDDDLAPVLQELRADSRRYGTDRRPGALELVEDPSTMGANFCMSEFNAALLCAQLGPLERQNAIRAANYDRLAGLLSGIPGVRLPWRRPQQDRLSLYEVPLILDPLPEGRDNAWAAQALSAELRTHVYTPRTPLSRSALLRPWTKPTIAPLADRFVALHRDRGYPGAEYVAGHAVVLHHSAFLGPPTDMDDIAEAVAKVVTGPGRHADEPRPGRTAKVGGHA